MVHLGAHTIDSNFVMVLALGWCSSSSPNEPHDTPYDTADSPPGAPYHAARTSHLETNRTREIVTVNAVRHQLCP